MSTTFADPTETANRTAKAVRIWQFIRTNAPEYARPTILECLDDASWAHIARLAGETRTTLSPATQASIIVLAKTAP